MRTDDSPARSSLRRSGTCSSRPRGQPGGPVEVALAERAMSRRVYKMRLAKDPAHRWFRQLVEDAVRELY